MGNQESRATRRRRPISVRSSPVTKEPERPATVLHNDAVTAITFCGDPWVVASAGQDRHIAVANWVDQAKNEPSKWEAHTRAITEVAYSKRLEGLFSASRDTTVKQWSLAGGLVQDYVGHEMAVTGIAVHPVDAVLASGARNGDVFVWDVATGARVKKRHTSRNVITAMAWIPETACFAQTSEDKMLRIWDSRNLTVSVTFPRQQYFSTCCSCADNGNVVVTGTNGFDGSGCFVSLWDIRTKEKIMDIQGHTQRVTACTFIQTDEGKLLCTASMDGSLRLWNALSGECLSRTSFHDMQFTSLSPVKGPGGVTNLAAGTANGASYILALRKVSGGHKLSVLAIY